MEKKKTDSYVLAVCKDPGGMNGIVPVVNELRNLDVSVMLISNGKASELLTENGISHLSYNRCEDVLKDLPIPDVLLTSMCSKGGVGRDLVPMCRERHCKVIALQDMWGARLATDWVALEYRPDFIIVNDDVGARIVKKAWPDLNQGQIVALGYPVLDKYAGVKSSIHIPRLRKALGVKNNKKLIFFGGQTRGSGSCLKEVVLVLNSLCADVYLLPKMHPRMQTDAVEEFPEWREALSLFKSGMIVREPRNISISSLLVASDVVVSMFSTVLMEGAVLGKECIAVLYPNIGKTLFTREFGGLMEEYPLVELGCCTNANDASSLRHVMAEALLGKQKLRKRQEEVFRLDGKNAQRTAQFVVSLM